VFTLGMFGCVLFYSLQLKMFSHPLWTGKLGQPSPKQTEEQRERDGGMRKRNGGRQEIKEEMRVRE